MRINKIICSAFVLAACFLPATLTAKSNTDNLPVENPCTAPTHALDLHPLAASAIAEQLGWVAAENENRCGGYYLEPPFIYPEKLVKSHLIQMTSTNGVFSLHGTSISQGKVTITREGQQITANKAYLYRDPAGKFSAVDLMDHVVLREPNSLVVAEYGHFDVKTKAQSLNDLTYRTTVYSGLNPTPPVPTNQELQQQRKIVQLSAWGQAAAFKQDEPKIFNFKNVSYSTCPPLTNVWKIKSSDLELNKITGRGVARNTKLYVKGVPILYTPYFNFPIDARRQTGFLQPTFGTSSKTGVYARTPFYWNMAPNYDTTLTPAFLGTRGMQVSDVSRYLTPSSSGEVNIAVLPSDRAFSDFQEHSQNLYQSSTNPATLSELSQLENASDTRKSISWQDKTRFNDHWSGDVDYSHVSDSYYLRDLSNNLNEVTQNQLLEEAQLNYHGRYWNALGRTQGYQTLHPIDETPVQNQYTRLPELGLDGNYPNAPGGLNYNINTDATHFVIHDNPGSSTPQPIGNRLHLQPSISLPMYYPAFYINPRVQFALNRYELSQVPIPNPTGPSLAVPIVDIDSGLYFDRDVSVFHNAYRQTLEPRLYYVYIPFKDQNQIPIFDTTLNNLTYDELFTYNRFSGLDRIGDTDQVSAGVTTRLIDQDSGYEKLSAGLGQIYYFRRREVDLCYNGNPCQGAPSSQSNLLNRSPLSGVLKYNLNPLWSLAANSIWNPQTDHLDNQTVTLNYTKDPQRVINLGYSFVRNGDLQPGENPNSGASNLSQTDFSFGWPVVHDWSAVARWTQNWNHSHFQNLLYGLQYDSCCWAVRFVTGRSFVNLSANNTYQYNTQFFVEFALKGLGNFSNSDPGPLLSNSVAGYQTNFGRDF